MKYRVRALAWLWIATLAFFEIFHALWRWMPRVARYPTAKRTLSFRLVRDTETFCPLDPALHDCNLTLEGSCPADSQRSVVRGAKMTIGRTLFTWPRDA